jgi:hypothetical protein
MQVEAVRCRLEDQSHICAPDQPKKYEPRQQIDLAASRPCVNDSPDCVDVEQQSDNGNSPKHEAIFRLLVDYADLK